MHALKSALFPLFLAALLAHPGEAQESAAGEDTALGESPLPAAPEPRAPAGPNDRSFWGWGLGFVFTDIPISQSKFTVAMSELYYSRYLTDPNDFLRTAASLGVYGFALALPVPKVSVEMYVGEPTQDIQGKVGVGGFYDIAVGGHGGLACELGIRIKNRVDVSLFAVPAGVDSKRDYLAFMGIRDENDPKALEKPHVLMPYFGLFLSFNY
jgi:hypothetical protein